jgi:protein-disulfide isomerase
MFQEALMTAFRLLTVAALAIGMTACGKSPSAMAQGDPVFGAKVREYLLAHPEVLEEAMAKLQEQKQVAAADVLAKRIDAHRAALERDPRDFVINPGGKVTVVEFFDYRCGYCKLAEPEMAKLIKANPDVRFVFKEFVIFGAQSEAAARAAIGARAQGKYYALHQRFMAEKALDAAALPRLMQASGVDVAKAKAAGAQTAVTEQLADAHTLAQILGVEGTPAFFVGNTMIPGADMVALKDAIAAAKAKRV